MQIKTRLVLDTPSHWEAILPFTYFVLQVITEAVKTANLCLFDINTR